MSKLTFLGTGTSQGVPMIGCNCNVCKSTDSRDKRLRASVYVEYEGLKVLVDAGPDFREQMLREGIASVDAILLTHNHKDHTGGLDDIRAFNYREKKATQIYCEKYVEDSLRMEYSYAFAEKKYPGAPEWDVHIIDDQPFTIKGVEITPIRGRHYKLPVLGYRFGNIAYCTDMNHIPEEEFEKLKGLDHFIINTVAALRRHKFIDRIVVAVDVHQRASGHSYQKGKIVGLQIAAGNNQVIILQPAGNIVIPQGGTFFIGDGQNLHNGASPSL